MELLFAGAMGPFIIFLLRIVDVGLGTVRSLLVVRGARAWVPWLAFVEATVWVLAIGSAIQNLTSVWHLLGYSSGYAAGNIVGMWIEEKLAVGLATVRVVTRGMGTELATRLREEGYGVTEFQGRGRDGAVEMLLTVVKRRNVRQVTRIIESMDPGAFLSVDEPRSMRRGQVMQKRV